MSYNEELEKLRSQYCILDCFDLSDYEGPQKKLFGALAAYRDPVFKDNERLVFIADRSLTTTFENYPPDILVELQQHIHYYNIPHFFLVMLTNIDNIAEYNIYLQQKYYKQETIPIPHINV